MGNVYNNLVASFLMPDRNNSKIKGVHKSNELREHYNRIVSLSKRSPLYIVKLTDENQEYVLNIKEQSLILSDKIEQFADVASKKFGKKEAWTENSSVSARIISDDYDNLPNEFDIKVNRTAKRQCNQGTEYYQDGRGLPAGEYSFIAKVNDKRYEFKYSISKGEKNYEVMHDVTSCINKADIGVEASVENTPDGKIFMEFRSSETGDSGGPIFTFQDKHLDDSANGIVSYYGINYMVRKPESARFEVDGEARTTLYNKFVMNRSLEITLRDETEEPVHIGYSLDGSDAFDAVQDMFDTYNAMIDKTNRHEKQTGEFPRLNSEMDCLLKDLNSGLEAIGVLRDEEGHLCIDRDLAGQAYTSGEFQEQLSPESGILKRLSEKCRQISINPMEYVNKRMVTYPNYSRQGIGSSYVTSMYSGMIFNYYC